MLAVTISRGRAGGATGNVTEPTPSSNTKRTVEEPSIGSKRTRLVSVMMMALSYPLEWPLFRWGYALFLEMMLKERRFWPL